MINIETSVTVLLSFHVLGHEYRGLLVCNACAYHRENGEGGELTISDIQPLTDSPFQFSYADEAENLSERFKPWLEDVILTGFIGTRVSKGVGIVKGLYSDRLL